MRNKFQSALRYPIQLAKSVLALGDSPHAIALGVAIGIFIGLTPSVGVQTVMVLAVVLVTRRLFYFNASAAMASTYVSNPVTMLPMYYFWYHLGARFLPGYDANLQFDDLLVFDGWAEWWTNMCALAAQVGIPMLLGALLTAPVGAVIAYFVTYFFLTKYRARRDSTGAKASCEETSDSAATGKERMDEGHSESRAHSDQEERTTSRKSTIVAS